MASTVMNDDLLLVLFKQYIASNLKFEVLASIDLMLDQAVAKAVQDMDAAIHTQMDLAKDRFCALLITHEKRPSKS